jgi:cation diffusion facilitator CzcD-associated flavoprotein CzcO
MLAVPQTEPHGAVEQPIEPLDSEDQESSLFMSPIYKKLETNIPKTLMGYSDAPFPDDMQLFPRHEQVQKYLEEYGAELMSKITFQTQVLRVSPVGKASWMVEYKDLTTGVSDTEYYDAIVVATGHFSVPYIPDIPGLKNWDEQNAGSISHSKYYRLPDGFKDKKIIVIGSSASGLDIASQISPLSKTPLLVSQRSVSPLAAGFANDPNIEFLTEIASVDGKTRTVTFKDGRIEADVDRLLFCTGYLYSMPFLQDLDPPPITTGIRVENTYKHLFYAPRPTLAFLTLNQKIIPFPVSEAQSSVLAHVWAGRLTLPNLEDMQAWERSVIEERGDGSDFHVLKFPKDAEYINELCDWVASADEEQGKTAKRWEGYEYWARENFPAIRKAFVGKGEDRKDVTALAQVGFEYSRENLVEDVKAERDEEVAKEELANGAL